MTAVAQPTATRAPNRSRFRPVAVRVWAVLVLGMLVVPVTPWIVTAWTSTVDDGSHLIHDVTHAAHAVLLLGPALVAIALGRGRITAVQTLLAAFLIPLPVAVLGGLMSPADAAVPAVVIALLAAIHPERDRLLRDTRPHPALLALTAAFAVPLAVYASGQLHLQAVLPPTEAHAALGHWAGMGFWAASMVCLALLTALRTPAWRIPLYSGVGAIALVAVASMLYPRMPSSLGVVGGSALLGGALVFAGAAEMLDRSAGAVGRGVEPVERPAAAS
jgi:hypothetical protein